MTSPTEISLSQLSRLIGTPECPQVLDVRIDEDFAEDARLIPASTRVSHREISEGRFSGDIRKAVVVCQKGLKLSQGGAAILRGRGVPAETLEGGFNAWRDAGLPLVRTDALPTLAAGRTTRWVTRARPKIDRIACPWLIRRFVDPNAEFLFVSASEVMEVADRFNAIPFDMEDIFWSHRGERCSFDTMLEEFGIATDPLSHLATIVRGADTDRHDLAPESAGLLAVSLGLSRTYRDDLEQLDASMALYDAFYRWCRDAAQEGHDWPPAGGKSK
ncbi:sulfurtransferase [Rhodospirillaceae bacterium KN72]|uniref:Sulfurtransferase n=1 Tax=Pacificispira spongiicola TaxID=2729598 RepID=A0A7Y0E0J6_9PROT|nr:sulfurtransferase/chromate resistance protein [Pacificispira spongiicola]NMM44251.1 sulfurtransferase [Pacificispira spongiicola]